MRSPERLAMLLLSLALSAPVFAQNASANSPIDSARVTVDPRIQTQIAPAATPVQTESVIAPSGATVTGLRAGVHARETNRPDQPTMAATSQHMGQDRAMMIVGVAGLITGAIIGGTPGTIVMVGGAVVGLMGLYNYLQ